MNRFRTHPALLICFAFLAAVAAAQQSSRTDRKEKSPWTPDDILLAEHADQFRVSPDGKWAVWVKSQMDKDKNGRIANLFLTSLESRREIQLTRGTETHSQPRWSPGGGLIAFLSTRPLPKPNPDLSRSQLWLINPAGGEPWHLTEFARGIQRFQWMDDDTLLFSAQEDPALYEQERKKQKDTTRVVDDVTHEPPVRLFRLSVKDRKVARLTDNTDFIETWDATRDGRRAVTVHHQYLSYEWDQKTLPKTFLYDLATGERKEIFSGARIVPSDVRWARDASGFYAIAPFTTHPEFFTATIAVLYFYDLATGQHTRVNLDWENGLGFGFEITRDGFLALLADGARLRPARYTKSGSAWTRASLEGDHARNIFAFSLGDDNSTLLYAYSTASTPEQWFRASLVDNRISNTSRITDLNPAFASKAIARTEIVRWRGSLEEEIEGILYYPHDYSPGRKYPLITMPHGGPAGADTDSWEESWAYAQQLYNQRGAFVLKPNYHGSANYGLKFVESICCGKYYDLEVPDIEKGVDFLIARGLVDPERIATLGWSNGSILSIALSIANPERYKAVAAGAGDVEWFSDWANVDFGHAFDKYYFGRSPLEDPALYIRKSPVFQLHKVKAPTIIFFGTEDRNVPTSQGWTHYRALYHLGQVPVRFMLFPGEPHGLQQLAHQKRKLEEELAWMDRYLFRSEKPENEAFQKESPLAQALRRRSMARAGAYYGLPMRPDGKTVRLLNLAAVNRRYADGIPVPEVVKRGALEVGRFEVTRAQFAAFDTAYTFDPGTGNFPANGVSFEQARAYAEWLSKLTGQSWRLMSEEEAAPLYESRSGENTLDFWAGYALNPDDAARLAAKVKELPGVAPLLREAGSFPGVGKEDEELIFDLGGNVAEWVVARDGKGKALGGSADRPADPKAQRTSAAAEYIGFRVVRRAQK
jgi:dipeptidyl aminopeptidase/acylaminoacyl peptidase